MNIQLDPQEFKEVFDQAIISCLSDEKKEDMIRSALTFLTSEQIVMYGSSGKTTPLQQAFHDALCSHSKDVIKNYLEESPEFQDLVTKLLAEAIKKLQGENFENMVDRLVSKITDGLSGSSF